MTFAWTLVTGPLSEPLTLTEAKAQCRIDTTNEDALLTSYIKAAREAAERYMARALFTQTWKLQLSEWAELIWLPMGAPLQGVTTVQYYNESGTLTTLASTAYDVDLVGEPGRITRAPNQLWPTLQMDRVMPVIITYVAGWTDVATIPELIKQGCRLHVSYSALDRDGQSADADRARDAANACWSQYGRVWNRPPRSAA